ncbi:MAG: hypothetical protein R3F11_26945 [Verrucomicrobiales bacterium]
MKSRLPLALCVATLFGSAAPGLLAQALTPVATYSSGYAESSAAGDPAGFSDLGTGWAYLWNPPAGWVPGGAAGDGTAGAAGDPAHYAPLLWSGAGSWTADGDATTGNNQPAGFLRLNAISGHPALGSAQTGSVGNTQDRYVIAAYEIQSGAPAGYYYLAGSSISGGTDTGTPHRVLVHVNAESPVLNDSFPKDGAIRDFDTPLGELQPGDRIYVCVGPDGSAASDSFADFDFTIAAGDPPVPPVDPPPPPPPGGPGVPIAVANPGAEINGGVSGAVLPDASVPGWGADGAGSAQVLQWETGAGNGDWRFGFEDSAALFQPTDHAVAAGEAISLRFDASSFSGAPESLIAELWVDDGAGGRQVVAGREFFFASTARAAWETFQLIAYYGDLDAHAGKPLGIQFRANDTAGTRWVGVDGVRLTAYGGVDASAGFAADWANVRDRRWAGEAMWANRLQDWQVAGGQLECTLADAGFPVRTAHLLTHRTSEAPGNFTLRVRTGLANGGGAADSLAGFLVGAGQALDYRGAAMVHHNGGKDGGILAGIDGSGRAVFRDNRQSNQPLIPTPYGGAAPASVPAQIDLELRATFIGPDYRLELTATDPGDGDAVLSEALLDGISPARLAGNIALASHPGSSGGGAARYWFRAFTGSGGKLDPAAGGTFGPILAAQHTLSRRVLKLTAQLAPISPAEASEAELQLDFGAGWEGAATAPIDPISFTAAFRIAGWDDSRAVPYRVRVALSAADGAVAERFFDGVIRPDPAGKDAIVLGGSNCITHVIKSGSGGQGVDRDTPVLWSPDFVVFPHGDLTGPMASHQPDVLFFSGDQIYEGSSPTRADNSSALNRELDYLYKWFWFVWSFRDLMRDTPSVCIPDDHDVYQGNLWGQGGRAIGAQESGGYTRPARFVQMVERTQTSHLPDPPDPAPVEQGIGVYFSSLLCGGIDFAILEDRKFKNGFQNQIGMPSPVPGSGSPLADPSVVDPPGLELLGARQEAFLGDWITDWRGVQMKAALSQTMFSSTTTHTGEGLGRRYFDYDSGGWPRSGRDRAVGLLRKAFAPHICGDQHLSVVVQHGIDGFGDANYAFCMPAAANFFPRAFDPDNPGSGPAAAVNPVLRDYQDGFGNLLTTKAVANPAAYYTGASTNRSPLDLHDRAAGYAIVRFHKASRQITFENWPRGFDASKGAPYDGWPLTVAQADNYGRAAAAFLPAVSLPGVPQPAVTVIDDATGEVLYSIRSATPQFRPHVFAEGGYTVQVTDPETGGGESLALTAEPPGTHAVAAFRASHSQAIRGTAITLSWTSRPARRLRSAASAR